MSRSGAKFVDGIFVGVFVMYVFAGMMLAPFHGDEATIIHKANDWYTLTQAHDLSAILYKPGVQYAAQSLRIQDGVISSYGIGIGWTAFGLNLQDVPGGWDWQGDWNYNFSAGHMPTPLMLFVSRLTSTAMTALSVALVFAIARRLGGRGAAWFATALFALMPAVLLDGRRAMFEGATLLSVGLVVLAGLSIARQRETRRFRGWLLLGVAAGLGLASKHNLALIIVPVFLALMWVERRSLRAAVIRAGSGALTAVGVFLLLNPTWWGAPLVVPGQVLRLRENLSNGQVAAFGGYTNTLDRIVALYAMPTAPAQYYEDKRGWPVWIGGQIAGYEAFLLAGIGWSQTVSLVALILATCIWFLPGFPRPAGTEAAVFAFVLAFALVATFVLIPLPWQRYYLPLSALWAVYYAVALVMLVPRIVRFLRQLVVRHV